MCFPDAGFQNNCLKIQLRTWISIFTSSDCWANPTLRCGFRRPGDPEHLLVILECFVHAALVDYFWDFVRADPRRPGLHVCAMRPATPENLHNI